MKIKLFYIILFISIFFLSLNLTSAIFQTHQLLTNYTLIVTADNGTSCNITYIQYSDGSSSSFLNTPMNQNGFTFSYFLNPNNFTKLGNECIKYTCYSPSATPPTQSGDTCLNIILGSSEINGVQITVYTIFLLICFGLFIYSFVLIKNNPFKEDILKPSQEYALRKENRFSYYLNLMKKKFWIVGVFGIYIFLFLFTSILNTLVYYLGLMDLNLMLITFNNIMAWASIPFVLFWFVYILLYFYNSTVEILKYDFGGYKE